jgi:hypothetical protein
MAGGTKAPPQDSESGPWSMSTQQKQHQVQDQSKTFHERKRKILPAVEVSLDNADTVIEGGPSFAVLAKGGDSGN